MKPPLQFDVVEVGGGSLPTRCIVVLDVQPLDEQRSLIQGLLLGEGDENATHQDLLLHDVDDLVGVKLTRPFAELWNLVQILYPEQEVRRLGSLSERDRARLASAWDLHGHGSPFNGAGPLLEEGDSEDPRHEFLVTEEEAGFTLSAQSEDALRDALDREDEVAESEGPGAASFPRPPWATEGAHPDTEGPETEDPAGMTQFEERLRALLARAVAGGPVDPALKADLLDYHYGELPFERAREITHVLRRSPAARRLYNELAHEAGEIANLRPNESVVPAALRFAVFGSSAENDHWLRTALLALESEFANRPSPADVLLDVAADSRSSLAEERLARLKELVGLVRFRVQGLPIHATLSICDSRSLFLSFDSAEGAPDIEGWQVQADPAPVTGGEVHASQTLLQFEKDLCPEMLALQFWLVSPTGARHSLDP